MFEDIFRFIRQKLPAKEFYIVGGATRDFLLLRKNTTADIDIATAMTPEEFKIYLPTADFRFAAAGNVDYRLPPYHLTFATFRREGPYSDHRHPDYFEFTDSYLEDSARRDFTVNAIYFDSKGTILDPQDGLEDIKLRNLRMIGDPHKRLVEDPLRIIRALRFSKELELHIDNDLYKAIIDAIPLLSYLSKDKITAELSKCSKINMAEIRDFIDI